MSVLLGTLGGLPGFQRRRVRVWAAVVLAIIGLLVFQIAFPRWAVFPELADQLGPATILVIFLAALGCEYVDSSLGMGYGTSLTPLLLLAGFEPLEIVPCVLLSEFVTGLCAAAFHQRDGNVELLRDGPSRTTAIWLSLLSVVGTVAAVAFAVSVSKFWLTAIISVIVLSVGLVTLATMRRKLEFRRGHIIALGTLASFNKGLSGGGYGPLVTAGQVVSGVSPKNAVAVTSLAEALTCAVGLVAYLLVQGNAVQWNLAYPLVAGALLSVPVATLTVKRVSESAMRASVGLATCLLGLLTAAKLFM